jgi:Rod binding domain-containing protein
MTEALIAALDADTLDALIAQTIASGRSIGAISFALRELKKTDSDLLEKLERKVGAGRYLRLIASTGAIPDLLAVIRYSSPSMAEALIKALDADTLDALIAQTIASGRSIGTIDLALRELKKTDADLLEKLERKIGVERYLCLVASAGAIPILFRVIQHSSPSMAEALIAALDADTLDALIAQTIASGRSIGTIDLVLRALKKTDADLLEKLERRIGAERWWQLICANGTVRMLGGILQRMDRSFRQEMVSGAPSLPLTQWRALLLRGDLADLCHFIRWQAFFFSAQLTPAFLDSLKPTLETLVRRADWKTLSQGAGYLRVASESRVKQYVMDLLHDNTVTIRLKDLDLSAEVPNASLRELGYLVWTVCELVNVELAQTYCVAIDSQIGAERLREAPMDELCHLLWHLVQHGSDPATLQTLQDAAIVERLRATWTEQIGRGLQLLGILTMARPAIRAQSTLPGVETEAQKQQLASWIEEAITREHAYKLAQTIWGLQAREMAAQALGREYLPVERADELLSQALEQATTPRAVQLLQGAREWLARLMFEATIEAVDELVANAARLNNP